MAGWLYKTSASLLARVGRPLVSAVGNVCTRSKVPHLQHPQSSPWRTAQRQLGTMRSFVLLFFTLLLVSRGSSAVITGVSGRTDGRGNIFLFDVHVSTLSLVGMMNFLPTAVIFCFTRRSTKRNRSNIPVKNKIVLNTFPLMINWKITLMIMLNNENL